MRILDIFRKDSAVLKRSEPVIEKKGRTLMLDGLASLAGWIGWGTQTGSVVNERTAVDVAAVYCAARVIAEGCAQMPAAVVREQFDIQGRRSVVHARDHWSYHLLTRRPNSWQTPHEFVEVMLFNAALAGQSLAVLNRVGGRVVEMLPVPPGAWSVRQLADWSIEIHVGYADKTVGKFNRDQVFILRGPSFDGIEALPAVRLARDAIGLSRHLESQQARLAASGGKPSGALSFENTLKPEQAAALRETWHRQFGPGGEGGIAILDGKSMFHSFTMTSVDAQHLETRRFEIEEIARFFRVLPTMLMQQDKASTFASASEMAKAHVVHTLMPWVNRFEQAFARDVLADEPGLALDLDERSLLRGLLTDQSEYFTKALGSGGQSAWMTVNEVRAETGLAPISDLWADTVSRGAMMPEHTTPGEIDDNA